MTDPTLDHPGHYHDDRPAEYTAVYNNITGKYTIICRKDGDKFYRFYSNSGNPLIFDNEKDADIFLAGLTQGW